LDQLKEYIEERCMDLDKWVDVTEAFSEKERHYSGTYLEIDEVYGELLEVSLFSSLEGPYEIYFSFERFYGIIYAEEQDAAVEREQVKKELLQEYLDYKEPRGDFIDSFAKKHKVCMPGNILFDASSLFE
jgi:hypothetical protein